MGRKGESATRHANVQNRHCKAAWTILVAAACLIASQTMAYSAPGSPKAARDAVQDALEAEVEGALSTRSEKLDDALQADPKSKDAHWHSGQLQRDGQWHDFKSLPSLLADPATMNEYRALRDKAPMTYRAQLELANWCRAHKLADQERAHLTAALELSDNPDDSGLRARLGQKSVGGVWMNDDDVRNEKQRQAAARKNLKAWRPAISRISKKLASTNDSVRQAARRQLLEINDPNALPALEAVFAESDLEASRLLVDALASFKTYKAAEPLARLAVLSEWDIVRKEAAAKLRERPVGAYVPQLLSTLRTPVDSKITLLVGNDGVHLTQRLSSDTQTVSQSLERNLSNLVAPIGPGSGNSITGAERDRNRLERAIERAELDAKFTARQAEREVAEQNDGINKWNDRVCTTLADATGVALPVDPAQWWEWWREFNQLSPLAKTNESDYSYETRIEYVELTPIIETVAPAVGVTSLSQTECLVAGTPIWTDQGLSPIESVQVGDLVLAKHPETGELAYRPVLRTSVREPEPVFKLTTEGGELRATGGHAFWVSGHGWTKLRDVKPQQRLHGAAKPAVVRSLEPDGKEKTYNLVVADFHTYFVGPDLVYSHDLTFARPVDAVVPGLTAK
jgi:hypothetical protein